MADYTPRIALPYLSVAQAQKEMAHNAALNKLDVLTQPVVQAMQNDPPTSPVNGQAWIVGSSPTGAWTGQSGKIGYYLDGWFFYAPFLGMRFYNAALGVDMQYDGSAWAELEYGGDGAVAAVAVDPDAPETGGVIYLKDGALKLKTADGAVFCIVPNPTVSLFHFDADLSDGMGTEWTAGGGIAVSTTQQKFGAGSLLCGSGKYLRAAPSNKFRFGGDFAIDAWVYLSSLPTSDAWPGNWNGWGVILERGSTGAGDGWRFMIGATKIGFGINDAAPFLSGNHGMAPGAWYHVELDRSGNDWYLFVNGSQVATLSSATTVPDTGAYVWIGTEPAEGAYFPGYIDELRVTNGIARHTANFTPPVSAYAG